MHRKSVGEVAAFAGHVTPPDSSDDEPSSIEMEVKPKVEMKNTSPSKNVDSDDQMATHKESEEIDLNMNPLVSVLSTKELLAFASKTVPQKHVMQCSIIRDKRGIDRSLYPIYYLKLQGTV